MPRGERTIKFGNSWFSAKFSLVDRLMYVNRGRALDGVGGSKHYTDPKETLNSNHAPYPEGSYPLGPLLGGVDGCLRNAQHEV